MAHASRSLTVWLVAAVVGVGACAANGGGDEIILETDDGGATEPTPGSSSVLPASERADAAVVEAGSDAGKDAAKDAAKDGAGIDAGPPAPSAGDACAKADEIFTRTCGACGKQQALCLANAGGAPGGVVSDYSPCSGEIVAGCLPGTVETEACGNCGTRQRTCSQYCAWTTGACAGEPTDPCAPTAIDYTSAGCSSAGTVRTRTCGGACTWSNFTADCAALELKLVVSATPGETVSGIYPLRAAMGGKRLTGTCPSGSLSTATNYPYVYVELVNPTATSLTLSGWNTAASSGGPIIDTLMSWYAGNVKPADDGARKICAKGTVDACPSGLPCGDSKWAGLTGTNAITLPPSGSALLFFGSYSAAGGSSLAEGPVKLVVRTEPSP